MTRLNQIAIIGAGMAGLACARQLTAHGHTVHLFDKGRGPGGRMSTRRVRIRDTEIGFDHGAQYFTARDPGFLAEVKAWEAEGRVALWTGGGDEAWVGTPGMNAPIADMAARLDVRFASRIDHLVRTETGWQLQGADLITGTYDAVVIAVPAEQVSPLIRVYRPDFADAAEQTPSQPCWTVMLAFDHRLDIGPDYVRTDGDIAWAARNSSKPGRVPTEAWVIQAAPDWSRRHRGAPPDLVITGLVQAFAKATGVTMPPPLFEQAHSWLYARSGRNGSTYLWDAEIGLGVCGDWLAGPRVECAWLSGNALSNAMSGA